MSYIDVLPSDEESCYYAEHLEFHRDLDPNLPPAATDDDLAAVLPYCPNITFAQLNGVPDLSSRTLIVLAESAPNLAHLDVSGCTDVTELGLNALAAHSTELVSVAISRIPGIADPALARLVRGLPLLEELEMDSLPLVTSVSVRDIWIFGRGLKKWTLSGCLQVTDSGFPWVPEREKLRLETSLEDEASAQPKFKTWLETLPPLVLPPTHRLNALRVLDLSHCVKLTDSAVLGLVAHAPRIQHLNLAGCFELTDRALHALCALGSHLAAVDIAGLERVTDKGAFALASACRRLQSVDISFIPNLSDLVLLELGALPHLRRLAAGGLPRLTDNAACFLAEHALELEMLHLTYCIRLTLDGVRPLLRRLTKLEHLGLSGIPALRRRGVRRFSERPPERAGTGGLSAGTQGYEERKRGVYRVFRQGSIRALGEFLEKEEWRKREAERLNILFEPRGDDSRALY
ncbi:RNI-like protein [Trametes meyenii]|nr:RNI-like protein [Trametes meyenii]